MKKIGKIGQAQFRVIALVIFILISFTSHSQILTFEFLALTGDEATAGSNFNDANLSASTISRGAGLTASANAGRYNATNWAVTSIANAVSGNNYMEFTITPSVGYQFSVSSIFFRMQRSSTGNTALALRSSVDGYTVDLDAVKAVADVTTTQTFTFTFAQANSTVAVTYRLYSYAEASGGSGGIGDGAGDDIIVNGTTTSSGWVSAADGDWDTPATWTPASVPDPSAGDDVTIDHAVTLAASKTNNGTITVSTTGTLQINAGGYVSGTDVVYAATGSTLIMNNGGGLYGISAGEAFWPGTDPPYNVTIQGTGAQLNGSAGAKVVAGTLTLAAQFDNAAAGGITVNGTLQLNSGGYISTNAPVYGSSSTLVYNTTYGVGTEWTGNSTTAGTGVPNHVTIQNSATVTMPAANRGMAGNLNITSTNLTLDAGSGDLYIAGNWTRATAASFTPNGRAVFFNGSGTQIVSVTGGGTETFNYLLVEGSGTLQLDDSPATSLTVNTVNGLTLSSTNVTSTIDLNGQTFTVSGGGNLDINTGNRKITSTAAGGVFKITLNLLTVIDGGMLTFDATNTSLVLEHGLACGTGHWVTVNGILRIDASGYVTTNSPIYGSSSLLIYNSGGTYQRQLEWTQASGTIGVTEGYPNDVQLSNNSTLDYVNLGNTGDKAINGNLTVDAGSSLYMDYNSESCVGSLIVDGNVAIAGNFSLGFAAGDDLKTYGNLTFIVGYSLTTNNRAVFFIKDGTQTITAPAALTLPYIVIGRSGGSGTTAQLNGIDLVASAPNTGNAITFVNSTDIFDINGQTLTIGTAATANTISGSGTFTGSATSNITLLGTGSVGTMSFTSGSQNLGTLTLNRQASNIGFALGTAVTINTSLVLTNGLVDLGTNIMTLAAASTTSGASSNSYVIADKDGSSGTLRKTYTATGSFTFPIGDRAASADGSQYSPATLNFTAGSFASAWACVTTSDTKHGSNTAPTDFISRYWVVTQSGITSPTYNFVGTYLAADINGTEGNSTGARWDGANWITGTAIGSNTLTYNGLTNLPATNEITAGAPIATPSIAISTSGITAANVLQGTANHVIQEFEFAVTVADAQLTGITATTGGTYIVGDLDATTFKLRYSTDATLDGGDATLSTKAIVATGNTIAFTGLTQTITAGSTGYFFITGDIAVAATPGNTINIATTAFTNITFSSGSKTGTDPVAASGAQTITVAPTCDFSDNFNRADNTTIGGGWTETGGDAEIISNELILKTGGVSGLDYVVQDVNASYETTFDAISGTLKWEFNMRHTRTDPSGLASGNYGTAFILGGTSSDFTTGTGYAVTHGNTGTTDNIRLVSFSGGVDGTLTELVASGDYGDEHLSIRVTFNEANDTWELFVRNDGVSFADPTTLAGGNSQGTSVNTTYTSTDLIYTGCYWAHATGATEQAEFDNVCIVVTAPCTAPTSQPSGISFSSVTTTSMTVNWSGNGDGNGRIVVVKASGAVAATPVNGTAHTANVAYGSGDDIGTNEYVVYRNTGGSVNVTGLSSNTTYYYAIYEYNNIDDCYYMTSPLTGNQATLCDEPGTASSSIVFTNIASTTMDIGWTNGNGDNHIVVVSTSAITVAENPVDASTYSANAAFTSGDPIGSGYVVYNSTGNSVSVTGLTATTTYYVAVYEYSCTPTDYLTSSYPTSSQSTYCGGTSTALFQGLEVGNSWSISSGAGSASTGGSDTPASQRILTGTNSFQQVGSGTSTLILNDLSVAGYVNNTISMRVTGTSLNGSNGLDSPDELTVFVALDGGAFPGTADITITGSTAGNSRWGYNATLTASTTAGTPVSVASPQGDESTNNYSTINITVPDGTLSVALKIIASCGANEVWNVDDIDFSGCPSTTVSTSAIAGSPFCVTLGAGASVTVNYTSTGTFAGTNDYTAQLSNSSGSFASPTNIGSDDNTSANSGSISATIPAATASGTGYRIRVTANDPVVVGSDNGVDFTIVYGPENVSGASTSAGNTLASVSWTNPATCFDEILVVGKAGGSVSVTPSGDGSAYTANAVFASGTDLGGSEYAVYKGTGGSETITALTNGTNYCFKIFTRKGTTWSAGEEECVTPTTVTSLNSGDFIILGIDANHAGSCGGGAGDDEISFVCFSDILTGSSLEFTDNGWQRENANKWGNTEGTIRMTRTGGTISAGVVMTLSVDESKGWNDAARYTIIEPADAGWSFSVLNFSTTFNLNSGGDQIFFMQGGTWNGGTLNDHDATYTGGAVLYGFSTVTSPNDWVNYALSTQRSGPYPSLDCFSMAPTSATDFNKYTGLLTAATKLTWIGRINDPDNWTSYASCSNYAAGGTDFSAGYTITINAGSWTEGEWTGAAGSTDWFECGNWGNMTVPDNTVNVTLPASGPSVNCNIGDPTPSGNTEAACNSITNNSSGYNFTINNAASVFHIYGDFANNATFTHSAGLVEFKGAATQTISGSADISFYNVIINKSGSNHVTVNKNFAVNNVLTLTDQNFVLGTNNITIASTGSISGGTSGSYITTDGTGFLIYNNLGSTGTSTDVLYPIGFSSSRYTPITFNNTGGTDDNYSIRVSNNVLADGTSGAAATENVVDVTWNIEEAVGGGSDCDATFQWPASEEISGFTRASCYVSHYTASAWTQPASSAAAGADPYTLSTTGMTSFSPRSVRSGAILPIELLSFRGSLKNKQIKLTWVTGSEINNDFFTLEKSMDANDFESFYSCPGAGNSSRILTYSTIDSKPFEGISYYRLKQTDYDGKYEYSNILSIYNSDLNNVLIQSFSQFEEQITIKVINPDQKEYVIEITDMNGKLVYKENTAEYQVNIQSSLYGSGIYNLRINNGVEQQNRKFIIE